MDCVDEPVAALSLLMMNWQVVPVIGWMGWSFFNSVGLSQMILNRFFILLREG
jgi:hypothetical protein